MNLFNIFRRKPKVTEPPTRYYSDILLNDSDGAASLGVQDYTRNPSEFEIDIKNFPVGSRPLIKVEGLVTSLETSPSRRESEYDYHYLSYEGFIVVGNFPLHFGGYCSKDEDEDLGLRKQMLETAATQPITMTGILRHLNQAGKPYSLDPRVLELGHYISPSPRRMREQPTK